MKNKVILFVVMMVCAIVAHAQFLRPVSVTTDFKEVSATEGELSFVMTIKSGWHVYGTKVVNDGPTPTTIKVEHISGAQLSGALKSTTEPLKRYEDMFGTDVYYHENSVRFVQMVKLLGGKYSFDGFLEYGACNDENCIPPTSVDFSYSGEVAAPKQQEKAAVQPDAPAEESVVETNEEPSAVSDTADTAAVADVNAGDLWAPVTEQLKKLDDGSLATATDNPLWYVFVLGFLGGLVALVTPCVWPIIPMTVSFFLKRGTTKKSSAEELAAAKRRGRRDAFIYGASIVVIYVALGLAVTGVFGASALNSLATNAVFNIIFFLMLLLFGASFIGGFELTLPAKWTSAVDDKANSTSGLLSIFLMAFTLVLVSFSCTGPIIGFLLVEMVTSSSIIAPTFGMLGFSLALALPFTLFALFPTMLKSAPKSGGWMNVVKVTLGFVELAFSLKFFSVADLAYGWGLLDRETFLALWIVLFALLGCYLIGWVRFPHDEEEYDENGNVVVHAKTSVPRFFMALVSLAFAVYMVPGLWGAPLKAVSAFAPPMKTQDFNLVEAKEVKPMFTDYEEGMAYAAAHGKPVMIDFTGYGCVNCRKMEAAVFTDATVSDIMTNDYVLIQLYVDDKTALPSPIEVDDNGEKRKLRTVGDNWSYLQSTKFGATAQPFYVLLDGAGNPLNKSYSYDEDVDKFLDWLREGLRNMNR
ncbi:MAG: thioredoxin family protein [Bacteroidaceae bacterium]|nr:thioredoxin family protein [Bacteroidaceae bacterium]